MTLGRPPGRCTPSTPAPPLGHFPGPRPGRAQRVTPGGLRPDGSTGSSLSRSPLGRCAGFGAALAMSLRDEGGEEECFESDDGRRDGERELVPEQQDTLDLAEEGKCWLCPRGGPVRLVSRWPRCFPSSQLAFLFSPSCHLKPWKGLSKGAQGCTCEATMGDAFLAPGGPGRGGVGGVPPPGSHLPPGRPPRHTVPPEICFAWFGIHVNGIKPCVTEPGCCGLTKLLEIHTCGRKCQRLPFFFPPLWHSQAMFEEFSLFSWG